jgi:hypothetical protein
MDKEDVLRRVYGELKSLRQSYGAVNPHNTVDKPRVELYEKQLDKLEAVGYNINDFRIPPDLLQNEWVEANYDTHAQVDTGLLKLQEGYFLTKLDSVLTYFALTENKAKIGFWTN